MEERPAEFQRLQAQLNSPASPQDLSGQMQQMIENLEKRFDERISKFDSRIEEEEFNKKKAELHGQLAGQLDGYDADAVEEFIAAMDQEDPVALYRMAHFARQGMTDPEAQARREAAQREIKEKNAGIVGGSSAPAPEVQYDSVEAGREAAARDLI